MEKLLKPINQSLDKNIRQILIEEEDLQFARLDKILARKIPDLSRTQIQDLYDKGLIEVNGSSDFSLSKKPTLHSEIKIYLPPPENYDLEAENIPLDILYQDDDLLFINKAAGMCVHPAAGNWHHTLVHALLFHCPHLKGIGNIKRPGIVHRLDIGTSGVMVVAKSQEAHKKLIEKFQHHDLERKYLALILKKNIPLQGRLETFIDRSSKDRKKMTSQTKEGKKAITHYKLLKQGKKVNLIECRLETGRTHQIRVHMAEQLSSPIINDFTYANPKQHVQNLSPQAQLYLKDYPYPLLHAKYLALKHPITDQWLEFETPPPSPFKELLELLERDEL